MDWAPNRYACLDHDYALVHTPSPSALLLEVTPPAKPVKGIFTPVVTPLLLGLYTRFFSDTERLIGPRFSCTVDGDGPPHGLGANVTVGTWNVHGIADSISGEIDHKRHELSRWIDSCSRRPSLLFVQETWLHADDTLDIDDYTWLGAFAPRSPHSLTPAIAIPQLSTISLSRVSNIPL